MRIAVIEDDHDQAKLLMTWLEGAGYDCHHYDQGKAAIKALQKESFDLLLLDWMLPDISGDQVLSWLRENLDWRIPVIFVTQKDAEEDIAYALEQGADDYIVKPIKPLELKARIIALTRRIGVPEKGQQLLEFNPYKFDTGRYRAFLDGEGVALTQKEFELAVFMFKNSARLLSRSHLLEAVWGHSSDINTRTLDTHISRLRKKLNFGEETGWLLNSIYHHGYRLENVSKNQRVSG